ncbi:MAG: MmgE/PrpD family protein [Betaproteobacteria bacterium]|nr:MmgE/PrpD family protein [Betaproteobacteria bacterium]
METIVNALARFSAGLAHAAIPPAAADKAKVCILDLLGVAFAGAARSNAQVALKTALRLGAPGKAAVWSSTHSLRAVDAVLPNSVASHCILQDDWLPLSHSHVGAAVVPTALAIAAEEGSSGAEVIAAVVAAYDVADRAGHLSVPMFSRGFRASSLCAYFGAAAAAAKLMRLDPEQTANALGFAGSVCGGVLQPWREGSMEWSFQEGFAARAGIMAAYLAQDGLAGSRTVIEGASGVNASFAGTHDDERGALDRLAEHFHIVDTCFKRFPTGGANQGSASVAHVLKRRHGIDWRRIEEVEVDIPKAGTHERMNYAGIDHAGAYRSFDQCLISKQFAIAMNLKTGDMSYADMERERENPGFLELTRRIQLRESDTLKGWDLRMRIHLDDGRCLEGTGADVDKDQLYLTWPAAVDKFRAVTRGLAAASRAESIVDAVSALDRMDSVLPLTALLNAA